MTAFMSKTDKTAPWRVKALYYPSWVVEVHDHVNGRCELPERPTPGNIGEYAVQWLYGGEWLDRHPFEHVRWPDRPRLTSARTCHWAAAGAYWCSGMARCGCDWCDGANYETRPVKPDRAAARRYTRGGWRAEY